MARAKKITERVEDLEALTGVKEPLNILFVSFIDSEGRRCKACPEYEDFLSGLASDDTGIKVFIPICEGCQRTAKVVQC